MFPPLTELRLVVQKLPVCTQEHSRHTNKVIAMSLLQCWLDKCLSAGLLPLKRWSCASLLVNDLTHFYPLQFVHKPLSGGCSYSPLSFPTFMVLSLPIPPSLPIFFTSLPSCCHFAHTLQADGGKVVHSEYIFSPLMQSPSLQNQHGTNKFNMNWRLMKCAPPSHPADCQPFGRRLGRTLWNEAERRRESDHRHN